MSAVRADVVGRENASARGTETSALRIYWLSVPEVLAVLATIKASCGRTSTAASTLGVLERRLVLEFLGVQISEHDV